MHWLLPMALLAANIPQAVITAPVANMYARPTEDADVVSQAIYGATVAAIDEQPGWLRIRTPDDYTGWTPAASVRRLAPNEPPYASAGPTVEIESLFAHLYREPDVTKHAPLITVPFEAHLEIKAAPPNHDRWIEVRLPDTRTAWLQRGDAVAPPQPLSIPQTIAFARRFLGLPYTWGGTSTFGYDCSGFTQMLCRRRGVLIPRDAGPQAAWSGAVPVNRDQLQPGDLLFFGSSASHITHSAMYIGDGEFINATTWQHPIVQNSKLSDPHWSHLLVACRRLK